MADLIKETFGLVGTLSKQFLVKTILLYFTAEVMIILSTNMVVYVHLLQRHFYISSELKHVGASVDNVDRTGSELPC